MSRRAQKWILWLALFGLMPVPFVLAGTAFAPPLRILFLATLLGGVAVADGAQGPMLIFLGLLFGEVVIFGTLSYLAAGLVLRVFGKLAPQRFVAPLVAVTIASLLGLSFLDIYHTPHSSSGPYSNIAGLFD